MIIPKHKIQSEKLYNIVQKPSKLNEFTIVDFICLGFGIISVILVVTLASTIQVNREILFDIVFGPIGNFIYIYKYIYIKEIYI